jgi:hypothetical protein
MPKGKAESSVGDLIKAKELRREDVEALFNGETRLPLPNGFALVLPDLAKLTPTPARRS